MAQLPLTHRLWQPTSAWRKVCSQRLGQKHRDKGWHNCRSRPTPYNKTIEVTEFDKSKVKHFVDSLTEHLINRKIHLNTRTVATNYYDVYLLTCVVVG